MDGLLWKMSGGCKSIKARLLRCGGFTDESVGRLALRKTSETHAYCVGVGRQRSEPACLPPGCGERFCPITEFWICSLVAPQVDKTNPAFFVIGGLIGAIPMLMIGAKLCLFRCFPSPLSENMRWKDAVTASMPGAFHPAQLRLHCFPHVSSSDLPCNLLAASALPPSNAAPCNLS